MKRLFIFTIVLAIAILSIWGIVQYFAPPPSLSQKRSKAYEPIIAFAAQHKSWKNFTLDRTGGLYSEGKPSLRVDVLDYKTKEEIRSNVRLLNQTSTMMVYRVDDMLLFRLEPRFPLEKTPGYVYSTDGVDPNQQDTHLLNVAKPFYALGNGWYSSKEMNTGAR